MRNWRRALKHKAHSSDDGHSRRHVTNDVRLRGASSE